MMIDILGSIDEVITGKKNGADEPNLRAIVRSWTTQAGFAVVWFKVEDGTPFVTKTEGDIEGITGYSHEEMLNKSLFALIQPSFNSDFDESVKALEEGKTVCKFQTAIRKDGTLLQTFSIVKKEVLLDRFVEFVVSEKSMKKI